MAQSNPEPPLDKNVEKLHTALEEALGGPPPGGKPDEPYWDTSSTEFVDEFGAHVDELLQTYADQAAGSPSGASQSAAKRTSG
jgi:hypothetical protein